MTIDHICFAVKNLQESIKYWTDIFGYIQMTNPIANSRQKVKVVFLNKEKSLTIKLIEPIEGNVTLESFVNNGGGFHHLCFKCDNIDKQITELKDKGVRMLVSPQPGEAFANNNIAFLWAKNRLNFELIDTDIKSEIIHITEFNK